MDFNIERQKKECVILKLKPEEVKTIINALKRYRKLSETLDEEFRADILFEDISQIYCCLDTEKNELESK